jgi:hypothetical protein
MSALEFCPNCEIALKNGVCEKCGFQHKTGAVKIEVGRSAEVEALRREKDEKIQAVERELEEKKAIIEQSAMSEFEVHKAKLAEQFNDSAILDCQSPREMYDYIASKSKKPTEQKRAPFGKAQFTPSNEGADSAEQLLDSLYFTAYYDVEATAQQKKEARQKISTLFETLISSPSWRTIKESGIGALGPIKPHMDCPKCHATIQNYPCRVCGYEPKKHEPYLFKTSRDVGSSGLTNPK